MRVDVNNPKSTNEKIWKLVTKKWIQKTPQFLISIIESKGNISGHKDLFKKGLIRAATDTGTGVLIIHQLIKK